MSAWHRSRGADLGLRMLGILFCACACATFARLTMRPSPVSSAGNLDFLYAAIGFLGASVGSALLTFGRHLFDEIPVGPRVSRSVTHDILATEMEES